MSMWAEPDPNHAPKFHTVGEDVRDLARLIAKVVAWTLGTMLALALLLVALALTAWTLAYVIDLLHPVPVWAWLMIIPLFGIWYRLSTKDR